MDPKKWPWHKEYRIFGIPNTLSPYPDRPVHEILTRTAKKYKKNGLVQNNFHITYPELEKHVKRLATALVQLGLRKGDRVATLLPTSIQFFVVDHAISMAGLVQIPASPIEPSSNLKHKFLEGRPKALIFLDDYREAAQAVSSKTSIEHLISTHIDDYAIQKRRRNETAVEGPILELMDLIEKSPPSPPEHEWDVAQDLETLLFTGGTTGLPKGCMLTHLNIYANAIQNLHAMGQSGLLIRGAVSVLIGLPLFHSYGHMVMHSMTLFGFNQILVNDPRDVKTMVQMIKAYRPLLHIGVPTQFMKVCEEELEGAGMLGLSGSAPLPPSAQEAYEKKASGGIMEGYGLSEMSPVTHLNTTYLLRLLGGRALVAVNSFLLRIPGVKPVINRGLRWMGTKTVGYGLTRAFSLLTPLTHRRRKRSGGAKSIEKRGTIGIPFPDTEIRLVDTSTGEALSWDRIASGDRGEMLLRGPQCMLGYWPTPGDGLDEEGFVHTSDVVRIDEKGYFHIVDRTKDMIIVSGFKVYSREIDDILFAHEAVEMAATVGIPDPKREGSEIVIVYVQPHQRQKEHFKEASIISYLRENVAKYAVPRKVFVIDELPLTEVQKINKKKLRKMAMKTYRSIGVEEVASP